MEKKEKKKRKKKGEREGVKTVKERRGACIQSLCKAHQIPERTTRHTTVAHVVKC